MSIQAPLTSGSFAIQAILVFILLQDGGVYMCAVYTHVCCWAKLEAPSRFNDRALSTMRGSRGPRHTIFVSNPLSSMSQHSSPSKEPPVFHPAGRRFERPSESWRVEIATAGRTTSNPAAKSRLKSADSRDIWNHIMRPKPPRSPAGSVYQDQRAEQVGLSVSQGRLRAHLAMRLNSPL